jgi:hypothetical protein
MTEQRPRRFASLTRTVNPDGTHTLDAIDQYGPAWWLIIGDDAAPVATENGLLRCYEQATGDAAKRGASLDEAARAGRRAVYDLGRQHGAAQPVPSTEFAADTVVMQVSGTNFRCTSANGLLRCYGQAIGDAAKRGASLDEAKEAGRRAVYDLGRQHGAAQPVPSTEFAADTVMQVSGTNFRCTSATPGRGGGGMNNKRFFFLCGVIMFSVANVFRPRLLGMLAAALFIYSAWWVDAGA